MKSLMKIYLAEADGGDSLEERVKTLQRQIEEIHNELEIKEGENNSLSDRLEEFETLKEQKKERERQKRKRKNERIKEKKNERMPKRNISPWKI